MPLFLEPALKAGLLDPSGLGLRCSVSDLSGYASDESALFDCKGMATPVFFIVRPIDALLLCPWPDVIETLSILINGMSVFGSQLCIKVLKVALFATVPTVVFVTAYTSILLTLISMTAPLCPFWSLIFSWTIMIFLFFYLK